MEENKAITGIKIKLEGAVTRRKKRKAHEKGKPWT